MFPLLFLSTDLTFKCRIKDVHRTQKPSLCSRTSRISSCRPHVHSMRLGSPVILDSSTTSLPIPTSNPITKPLCHFMIAGTSRD